MHYVHWDATRADRKNKQKAERVEHEAEQARYAQEEAEKAAEESKDRPWYEDLISSAMKEISEFHK